MPRPCIRRRLRFNPKVKYFKPQGVPMRHLEEVLLLPDELEAIKLHDVDGLDQIACAKKMGISQPTFARIINRAYKKIAISITKGKALKVVPRD